MKKLVRISLLALTLALAILALAACKGEEHVHTWSDQWNFDPTHHWHTNTCEHEAGTRLPVNARAEHDFSETRNEPTCTVSGKITRVCKVCGYKIEATIAANGHTYTAGSTVLSANESGSVSRTRTCDVCHVSTTTVIPGSVAVTPDTVQAVLDAAGENGAYVYLQPGNYGTLYLRAVAELSTEHTAEGGVGKILHRTVSGITIIAAEGATVDAIVAVGNTEGTGADAVTTAVTLTGIELVDITFTGTADAAIDLSGNVAVDGLSLSGCHLAAGDAFYRAPATTPVVNEGGTTVLTPGTANLTAENCTLPDGTAFRFE